MQAVDFSRFTSWEARFETNDLTPPPFSYSLSPHFEKRSDRLFCLLCELVYTHREELTQEELAEGGFTLNDKRAREAYLHAA